MTVLTKLNPYQLSLLNTHHFGASGSPGASGTSTALNGVDGTKGHQLIVSKHDFYAVNAATLSLQLYDWAGAGGNGGDGWFGADGSYAWNGLGYNFNAGSNGGNGGNGGGGGATRITLQDVQIGTGASPLTDAYGNVSAIGYASGGGRGGLGSNGGNGGYNGFALEPVGDSLQLKQIDVGGAGGKGGNGGHGRVGGDSTVLVDNVYGTLADGGSWTFQAVSAAGTGGAGGAGGPGGTGGAGGKGGNGGNGAAGGGSAATLSNFGIAVLGGGAITMNATALGGYGGQGGAGGEAGDKFTRDFVDFSSVTQYATAGGGGAGGKGGDGTVAYTGNNILAEGALTLNVILTAHSGSGGLGGAGGSGGFNRPGPQQAIAGVAGAAGAAGANGLASIIMTGNTINLGAGSTLQLGMHATLNNTTSELALSSTGPAILTFSGNSFEGNGGSSLGMSRPMLK